MVEVYFYCSSPYVGYALKQADYIKKEMLPCNSDTMISTGYTLLNSSGSYMLLGKLDGKKYFHSKQSESEQYDEQNRRIYTDVAFIGETAEEEHIINKIAAYVFFRETDFYAQMASLIQLTKDGFTVDFDKLTGFLERFIHGEIEFSSTDSSASSFCRNILSGNQRTIDFVVLETTWPYFTKQLKTDFHDSVGYKFTLDEVKRMRNQVAINFVEQSDSLQPVSVQTVKEEKKEEPYSDVPGVIKDKAAGAGGIWQDIVILVMVLVLIFLLKRLF